MSALQAAEQAGKLPRDPADARQRRDRQAVLRRHDWVVYAKTPLSGPAAVLDYLSRYTHRTAIGNERLVDIRHDSVRLRVRADDHGGKRTIAMPCQQFIGRLLQHMLAGGQPTSLGGRQRLHAARGRHRTQHLPPLPRPMARG